MVVFAGLVAGAVAALGGADLGNDRGDGAGAEVVAGGHPLARKCEHCAGNSRGSRVGAEHQMPDFIDPARQRIDRCPAIGCLAWCCTVDHWGAYGGGVFLDCRGV